ncbi:MAG: hypothetical protein KIT84_07535 [Labilithrix sp.]|nr:hypothetical protein [Labilithrix sp.]MCW5810847.1 hypothetical protein [Labilithrix sp.]
MNESSHPAGFRLDGHVAGDVDAEVAAHVETCAECRAYVTAIASAAGAFTPSEREVETFLARVTSAPEVAAVLPLRRRFARVAWIATPFVAAAALFLILRRGDHDPTMVEPTPSGETRFKGGVQLSAIRDRDGWQERVSGEIAVRPGDRLRVDVAIDSERPVVVGFLGNDGSWSVLLAPTLLEAGSHLSERVARFDDSPTEGVILAGPPDAVEAARESRDFDGLAVLPVVWER